MPYFRVIFVDIVGSKGEIGWDVIVLWVEYRIWNFWSLFAALYITKVFYLFALIRQNLTVLIALMLFKINEIRKL